MTLETTVVGAPPNKSALMQDNNHKVVCCDNSGSSGVVVEKQRDWTLGGGGLGGAKATLLYMLEGQTDEHTCRTELSEGSLDECCRSLDSYDEKSQFQAQPQDNETTGTEPTNTSPANSTMMDSEPQVPDLVSDLSKSLDSFDGDQSQSHHPEQEKREKEPTNIAPSNSTTSDEPEPQVPDLVEELATSDRRDLQQEEGTFVDACSSSPSRLQRRSSILKRCLSEPLCVKEGRGVWKKLPPPDMDAVRLQHRSISMPEGLVDILPGVRRSNSVRFKDVQIRCYNQTLGDNPSVSYGMAIQLDWEYEEQLPLPLDSYEDNRGKRRSLRQMVLSYYHRRNVLMWQYGYTEEELKLAKKQTNKVKSERSMTRALLVALPLESALEAVSRKARRIVRRGGSS
jgi:hypothetical protein